jgi:hypothetical protein
MIGIGRLYTFTFAAVSISAQQDIFYVKPAADKVCVIEGIYVANVGGSADAGDAQEELYDVEIIRLPATVTVGSGGSASGTGDLNPSAVNDMAASFTARKNDTTKATTSGTARVLHADGWNVRIPYVWMPPPEHRLLVANAEAVVFRLNSTPADAVTCNGTMLIRELP